MQRLFRAHRHGLTRCSRFYAAEKVRKVDLFAQQKLVDKDYTLPTPQLVRDFIDDSLYNPEYGYFNDKKERLIFEAEGDQLIDFTSLEDEQEYYERLRKIYDQGRHAWGTPTEIFQPFYARALCDYILANRVNPQAPLLVYEVGGGNGTMAKNMLDYCRDHHPEIYKTMQYRIIEISSTLHNIQKQRLAYHGDKFKSFHKSITQWNTPVDGECFVIAMEVMDNMPHDKVVISYEKETYGTLEESRVIPQEGRFTKNGDQLYEEVLIRCQDPFILRHLSYTGVITPPKKVDTVAEFNFYKGNIDERKQPNVLKRALLGLENKMKENTPDAVGTGEMVIYVPTVRLMMLDVVKKYFPQHRLILADFDFLPNEEPGVLNAPFVQNKFKTSTPKFSPLMKGIGKKIIGQKVEYKDEDGDIDYKSQSYRTYLVPKGSCDIFFATDFLQLQSTYSQVNPGRGSVVIKSAQFMEKWANLEQSTTKSGYNPLLQDYTNFCFFLS